MSAIWGKAVVGRGLSYADAVRLLGESSSKTVAALDRLAGGVLLAVSAAGHPGALGLLEAKSEFARLSQDLVTGLSDRLQGMSRFARSERLAAAHSVLVLAAYFDALSTVTLPVSAADLKLDAADQVAIATGTAPTSRRLGAVANALLHADVPMPSPQSPYEVALEAVQDYYALISAALLDFLGALPAWEQLTEVDRLAVMDKLRDPRADADGGRTGAPWQAGGRGEPLVDIACARYQEFFRRLAAGSREVGFWANSTDHLATRLMIGRLATGLAGIEEALREMTAGGDPDPRRAGLAKAYRAALRRPILASRELPPGLQMPSLAAAYINPAFRTARIDDNAEPASESWWSQHQRRDDIQSFLLGYLTQPEATTVPLIVLGHPGAGKSVLTRVLAARMLPSEFLVVRVPLREAAAESDLQTQIEIAVRAATGESLSWPALVRTAGDALPLVLLDGFDELLQASGVAQSDYVLRIAQFQQREADQGRPVAVIVTSRTAVADRADYPPGTTAVRLEPFDQDQMTRWLEVWNDTNAAYFAERGLRAVPPAAVMAHRELACHPLLLLMLALYDAEGNSLANAQQAISRCDLYEQLLIRFASREVAKAPTPLLGEELAERTENELLQLALVAFSMFNRNRQWITETELDTDLGATLGQDAGPPRDLRRPLSPGALILGRFFFIHEAQATQHGQQRKTYEFLHATFGEYLIARLIVRELIDMIAVQDVAGRRSRRVPVPDDQFLRPLLSCAPLSTRGSVVMFLHDLLQAELTPVQRDTGRLLLQQALSQALEPHAELPGIAYPPLPSSAPARHACYSVNLVLLLVALSGQVSSQTLFTSPANPIDTWRRHVLLWRSQLSADGWASLTDTIAIERDWTSNEPDLQMTLSTGTRQPARLDPLWIMADKLSSTYRGSASWLQSYAQSMVRQSQFAADRVDDHFTHALEPLMSQFPPAIATFTASPGSGRLMSAAHLLIRIWLLSGQRTGPQELAAAYDDGLALCDKRAIPWDDITYDRYLFVILRQLAADAHHLPEVWLATTLTRIASLNPGTAAWIREAFQAQNADHLLPPDP